MNLTDGFIFDTRTGLLWHPDNLELDWQSAKLHAQNCKDLGIVWRIPEIWELLSIVNYNMSKPASEIDEMKADIYWTAQNYIASNGGAWVVNFDFGSLYIYNKSYKNWLRMVSGVYKSAEELQEMVHE